MRLVATLSTMVLGPREFGGPWDVLAATPMTDLEPAHVRRLQEILVSLSDWADGRESSFAALFPLGDGPAPALLIKVSWGSLIGPRSLSRAHAVILTPEAMAALGGRAERLLPLIQNPDESLTFARAALPVPPMLPKLPMRNNWQDVGLAWRDMVLVVREVPDVFPALNTVLALMDPPEQAQRITGWCTTAELAPAGDFDPWDACQLMVIGPGQRLPYGMKHQVVRCNPSGEPEVANCPPQSWYAWAELRRATGTEGLLPWHPDMTLETVPSLMVKAALHAETHGRTRAELLTTLLAPGGHEARARQDIGLAMLAGLLELDGAKGLPPAAIDDIGIARLLDGLAQLRVPARALARMPEGLIARLADGLPDHQAVQTALGSDMAAFLGEHMPEHPALPAIVALRMHGPPGTDLERMGVAAVFDALGPRHASLAMRLSGSTLRRPTATLATLSASLAAVRAGSGKAVARDLVTAR